MVHPEAIKELPEDANLRMTWDYSPTPREINVKKLWENGAHQYLCPGVQGWNQANSIVDNAYEKNICTDGAGICSISMMAGRPFKYH